MPRESSRRSHKGKEATHSEWSAWSDWVWDDRKKKYYSRRQDGRGNIEERSSRNPQDIAPNPRSPPDATDMEQLTEDFDQTGLSESPENRADPSFILAGRDSGAAGVYDPRYQVSGDNAYESTSAYDDPAYYTNAQYGHSTEAEGASGFDETADEDPGGSSYGARTSSGLAASAYAQHDPFYGGSNAAGYYPDSAKGSSKKEKKFKGQMDPEYNIHTSDQFRTGRIVKVWFPEARGQGRAKSQGRLQSTIGTRRNYNFSEMTYEGFRRFIIVWMGNGHSTIIPISTYGGQACAKKGVHPGDHGIVHDNNDSASYTPGEPMLGFEPIRAIMYENTEALLDSSRVNYAKLHNLEHNVPVWFVGEIVEEDMPWVEDAVWASKNAGEPTKTKKRDEKSSRDKSSRDHKSSRSKKSHH